MIERTRKGRNIARRHVEALDDHHLRCRFSRHRWDLKGFVWTREKGQRLIHGTLLCDGCSTVRHDIIDPTTYVRVGGYYEYPSGYRTRLDADEKVEVGRLTAADYRGEQIRRAGVADE